MSDDIRTTTLLKLADHMKSINKTLTELNKEVEEMMQDIMRDLREKPKGADDESVNLIGMVNRICDMAVRGTDDETD